MSEATLVACHPLSAQRRSDKQKCNSFVQLICGIFVNVGRNADSERGDEAFLLEWKRQQSG